MGKLREIEESTKKAEVSTLRKNVKKMIDVVRERGRILKNVHEGFKRLDKLADREHHEKDCALCACESKTQAIIDSMEV